MRVERETVVKVILDDNTKLNTGDTCVFLLKSGICAYGVFKEVTSKGNLTFITKIGADYNIFSIKPSSILELDIIEHEVK